jgi:transposase
MAHLYKKVKNGRDYYYIRETQRVYGKPTTINQVYLGTADKVQELLKQENGRRGFSPKEFGSIFAINEMNRLVDLPGIVDDILPPKKRTKGPTLGELLFYAAMNRAIAPTSKRQLASWYEFTDIQRVRPLRLESLNSQNFWNYWDRISEGDLERMALSFFRQVHSLLPPHKEHLVVEATNIFSPTPQPKILMETGFPKVGLAIVSERFSGVPLFYQAYPGGLPETGFYQSYLDSLLARLPHVGVKAQDFTVIFSQGIESEAALQRIDSQENLHFIASYDLDLDPELAKIPLKEFRPLPCRVNERRIASGEEDHQILYYETRGVYWNHPRRAIITFDPKAFQKRYQDLRTRVHKLRKELLILQKNYQQEASMDAQAIEAQLAQVCQRLNLNPGVFSWSIVRESGRSNLNFQLEQGQLNHSVMQFGKSMLITDREDWEAPEICRTFMERCIIDASDPQAQSTTHVTLMPLYHWTDSKVLVHMFVCVAALTYLALFNQRLMDAGLPLSPREAILEMRSLSTAIFLTGIDGKLKRALNSVTDTQNAILHALGYQVEDGKVAPL